VYQIVILAGPNGAGKTTFASRYLPTARRDYVFLNADEIARQLRDESSDFAHIDLRAGRRLLELLDHHVERRDDILLETTLSGRLLLPRVPLWRSYGYRVVLHYLKLPSTDASLARVKRRVDRGGHDIPEVELRRRFQKSLNNLSTLKPVLDEWSVFESLEGRFEFLESGVNYG
jgi:predicted ABC-type ATPase